MIEPTPAQQALWLLDQLSPGSVAYHIPLGWRLRGPLDVDALSAAIDALGDRHESLRTTIGSSNGKPRLQFAPNTPGSLRIVDLTSLESQDQDHKLADVSKAEMNRAFDLSLGPLWRSVLVRLSNEEHVLLLTLHHVVTDGWSSEVLWRDLCSLYTARVAGTAPALPALPIQFADYAEWRRSALTGPELDRELAYWKERLDGAPTEISLPHKGPRPPEQTFSGARVSFTLSPERTSALADLARRNGATLFTTLSAAIRIILSRYSGQSDICIGSPFANRNHKYTENLVGYFVNMVVLRGHVDSDDSFHSVLSREVESTHEAFSNAEAPFLRVVDALGIERDLSRTPVYQVMFVDDTEPDSAASLGSALASTELDRGFDLAQLDLTVRSIEHRGRRTLSFVYNVDLFDPWLIEQMAGHLDRLLQLIVERPRARLSDIGLLAPAEIDQLTAVPHAPAGRGAPIRPATSAVRSQGRGFTECNCSALSGQSCHYMMS